MVRYRLERIAEEIKANPPADSKENFTYYRIEKDTGLAYSTILRMFSDRPVKIIHTHALERLLECINKRRNPNTPEYVIGDLLEVVSESDVQRGRRRRKNG